MATYYVGTGGNNSNAGTSWAQRKLTLNGAEDIPVQAGDTVYVGAGTYREKLTCDVSGSSGSPISYIGDYDGSHTDGTGGVVRITASDDDKVTSRNICIDMNGKNYRTFNGFTLDGAGSIYAIIWIASADVDHLTVQNCAIESAVPGILCYSTTAKVTNLLVDKVLFHGSGTAYADNVASDNSGNVFQNCIYIGSGVFVNTRAGGTIVRNCLGFSGYNFVTVGALNSGQTVTVNNCIMHDYRHYALIAATLGHLVEDYNICPSRNNVAVGAHSKNEFRLFDTRWFHEMLNGGSMLTPFDLASYSKLINVAGTSPTTADMRGTAKIGTEREWGALEYDSTLDIEAGSGGAVSIQPIQGSVRL